MPISPLAPRMALLALYMQYRTVLRQVIKGSSHGPEDCLVPAISKETSCRHRPLIRRPFKNQETSLIGTTRHADASEIERYYDPCPCRIGSPIHCVWFLYACISA